MGEFDQEEKVGGSSEGYHRQMLKNVFAAVRREQQIMSLFFVGKGGRALSEHLEQHPEVFDRVYR